MESVTIPTRSRRQSTMKFTPVATENRTSYSGKRKRATRSPSPTKSESASQRPHKRAKSRSLSRAASAAPSAGGGRRARGIDFSLRPDIAPVPTVVRPSRQCFIWGNGDMGQFGLGTETLGDIVRPRLHVGIQTLAEGNALGGVGAGLESACAGGMHSLAIDELGRVWSWGINDNAALGRQTSGICNLDTGEEIDAEVFETKPMLVQSLIDEGFRAVKVAAGDSVSVALGIKGELRVWGSFRSSDGLLGFDGKPGSPKTQILPVALANLQQYQFIDVACGTDHILALTSTGHVYVWGNGQQAQLGRKIIERRKVNGLEPERLSLRNVVAIGSGSYHSFAVDAEGIVYAWGLNSLDQTGVKRSEGGASAIVALPTPVTSLLPSKLQGRRVVSVSGGEHHTLFLLSDGSVWGCGRCDGFELGIPDDHPVIKEVEERRAAAEARWKEKRIATIEKAAKDLAKRRARRASSRSPLELGEVIKENDESNILAVNTDQEAKPPPMDECVLQPVPIPFPPPPPPLPLSQLGNGAPPASMTTSIGTNNEADPVVPPWSPSMYTDAPLDPVIAISAGTRHNLAVTKAGFIYAWGFSPTRALGLGREVEAARTPTLVKSRAMAGWVIEQVAAGGQHCLALGRRVSRASETTA